jgi:TetR/AcrR family transcriptional repressor of nem operon
MRRTAKAMRDRLFARIDDKPAADRGEIVLKRYLSTAHRDDVRDGCSLPAVVGEVSTSATEHRAALHDQIDAFASELEAQILPHAHVSRRHLAIGLIALMYGGLSLARALRGTELSDEVLRACRAVGRLATRTDREQP